MKEREHNSGIIMPLIIIAVVLAIVVGAIVGFIGGRYGFTRTQDNALIVTNYKEAYLAEKAIAGASLELNHLFYSNDDNDYWYDIVINTKEYKALDSLMDGDWEDFYQYETPLMWESITYEPGYSY